ncbi:DUF808 domain-containing protein [Brevibacterium album]|uniref:DUF808 domain-containing protein n=1 Tax=Brevibacterium album TaxID=417948 RepID=UPI000401FEC5|nr:DUF808 domain-containing protein [Brevibacterium album]
MSGLISLLDDVAALARLAAASADDVAAGAAKASAKAAGVVIDDAAVTPQYVTGVSPKRELPMIWRIAKGSLINKLLIILPVLLVLSTFVPWLLTPLLMLGGAYLSYEGAHKIWDKLRGRHAERSAEPSQVRGKAAEDTVVRGAITTDFILSCEIMVISLNEVAAETLWTRAAILVVVGIGITVLVYGAVAVIVKMDDVGLAMTRRSAPASQRTGHLLVRAMPKVLTALSFIGTFAMLWVGGHILLVGMDELGLTLPYDLVHALEEPVHHLALIGPALAWLVNTFFSMVLGFLVGSVVVGVMKVLPLPGKH